MVPLPISVCAYKASCFCWTDIWLSALPQLAVRPHHQDSMDNIPQDFFSDLVPIKPNGSKDTAPAQPGVLQQDAVLPSRPESGAGSGAARDVAGSSGSGMQAMGDSRLRREVKEFEGATQAVVESILQRFADGLKSVLDDTSRRAPVLRSAAVAW